MSAISRTDSRHKQGAGREVIRVGARGVIRVGARVVIRIGARGAIRIGARVVMRIGAALSVTFNYPFAQIGAAKLDLHKSGSGTIALETTGDTKISYLIAWPHVRPWHFAKTQPALRSIADAARVARVFSDAAEQRLSVPVIARKDMSAAPVGAVTAK